MYESLFRLMNSYLSSIISYTRKMGNRQKSESAIVISRGEDFDRTATNGDEKGEMRHGDNLEIGRSDNFVELEGEREEIRENANLSEGTTNSELINVGVK